MGVKLQGRESSWIYVTPVTNLRLGEEINYELQVGPVTLVNGDYLPYRRKRLGFPQRISQIRQRGKHYEQFFDEPDTFAVARKYGSPEGLEEELLQMTRDSLAVVSLSKLCFGRRRHTATPMVANERPGGSHRHLFLDSLEDGIFGRWSRFGPVVPFDLTANWKRFHDRFFFLNLLKILNGEFDIGSSWREDIRTAAVLAGQSQSTLHLPQAFLWNVIVIELLLTRKSGEKGETRDTLPERAKAFLGWSGWWEQEGFYDAIREVWDKRVGLVHRADREAIQLKHLFFTDDLIFNLFTNIVNEIERFDSKEAIIEFSKKVKAERILGLEPSVRPKDPDYARPKYTDKDFEKTPFYR